MDEHRIADIIQNLFPTNQFIESESLLLDKEEAILFGRHFFELGQRTKYQQDREEFAKVKVKEWQEGYNEGYAKGLNASKESEVNLFECPKTPIKDAIEVTSRMKYIDEELKPIAEFIMHYASWNLHKSEWNQPIIEVPLFRVLDALVQKGKPYCEA